MKRLIWAARFEVRVARTLAVREADVANGALDLF